METILFTGAALVVAGIFAIVFARTQAQAGFERGVASTAEERAALVERVVARDAAIAQLQHALAEATRSLNAKDADLRHSSATNAALEKELDAERKATSEKLQLLDETQTAAQALLRVALGAGAADQQPHVPRPRAAGARQAPAGGQGRAREAAAGDHGAGDAGQVTRSTSSTAASTTSRRRAKAPTARS